MHLVIFIYSYPRFTWPMSRYLYAVCVCVRAFEFYRWEFFSLCFSFVFLRMSGCGPHNAKKYSMCFPSAYSVVWISFFRMIFRNNSFALFGHLLCATHTGRAAVYGCVYEWSKSIATRSINRQMLWTNRNLSSERFANTISRFEFLSEIDER